MTPDNSTFPEQDQPAKLHGTPENENKKEKYLRDSGKIEDYPDEGSPAKMNAGTPSETKHLTDTNGEEKKEDYINTDERAKDLNQRR